MQDVLMLKNLFSSKARVEILKLFLFNPEDSFYQREISNLLHQPIRAVQRELKNLMEFKLIKKLARGNRIYYKLNKKHPIYEELKVIFLKMTGIAEVLKNNLERKDSIKLAFIYGSYARGDELATSDIDLMVIGDISSKELSSFLAKPKQELKREINYVVFSVEEFKEKVKDKNHFLNTVLRDEKIFLLGDEDELKAIVGSE
jgi:predicted nucleotidyltransferase